MDGVLGGGIVPLEVSRDDLGEEAVGSDVVDVIEGLRKSGVVEGVGLDARSEEDVEIEPLKPSLDLVERYTPCERAKEDGDGGIGIFDTGELMWGTVLVENLMDLESIELGANDGQVSGVEDLGADVLESHPARVSPRTGPAWTRP